MQIADQKLEYVKSLTELTLSDCDGSLEIGSLLGGVISCPTSGWLLMEVRSSSSF